jgi:hypothetical protein
MLTTNPTTGLPEAGFLSSILPMLGGAAISVGSGGAIDPFTAAMLIGGGTGLATGNLQKGLTAGLGAYGGAGIAGGLGAAGATGAQQAASSTYANKGLEAVGAPSLATASSQAATPAFTATNAPTISGLVNPPAFNPVTSPNAFALSTPPEAMPAFQTASVAPQAATPVAPPIDPAMSGPPAPTYEQMTDPSQRFAAVQKGFTGENLLDYAQKNPKTTAAAFAPVFMDAMKPKKYKEEEEDSDPGQQYNYESNPTDPTPEPDPYGRGQTYFKPRYVNRAAGGVMRGLPSAQSNLGSYSDGGRLLRGPGDGVSDSIPAVIGGKQPARLADGEFVIPARIVSELGNGSTEAGAKQLYAMMDRIQKARGKTTGKKQVAKKTNARKLLPA